MTDTDTGKSDTYKLALELLPEGALIQRPMLGVPGMPFILIELAAEDDGTIVFKTIAGGGFDQDPAKVGGVLEFITNGLENYDEKDLVFTDDGGNVIQTGLDDEGDDEDESEPDGK